MSLLMSRFSFIKDGMSPLTGYFLKPTQSIPGEFLIKRMQEDATISLIKNNFVKREWCWF